MAKNQSGSKGQRAKRSDTSQKQAEVEKRRASVATLLVSGRKKAEIAAALNVSAATITTDVKALIKAWQESGLFDMDAAMQIDLERVEALIRSVWLPAVSGSLAAVDRAERLIRLRKEIIGYGSKPEDTINVNWQPITKIEVIKDYGPPEQLQIEMDPDE